MHSRSLTCWSIPHLTIKVGLNSPQYLINKHMGTIGQIPNWAGYHIHPPLKEPTSSSAQHTHNQTNDDQERSLLAHAAVCPVSALLAHATECRHMCHAVHPAKSTRTMNPMSASLTRMGPWPQRSALIPFVTPQSPNGSDSLCTLSEPHLPPSHFRFRPRFT
jgi:hypothetical protein